MSRLDAYLSELDSRLRAHGIRSDPILDEARDHLLCDLERVGGDAATNRALREFGEPAEIAATWALTDRSDIARAAARVMGRRLLAIAVAGHLVAVALPAMLSVELDRPGSPLRVLGVAGGALGVPALLVLHGIGARRPRWLTRRGAASHLRALIVVGAVCGSLGAAGLASRLSSALPPDVGVSSWALAVAAGAAAWLCLLRPHRPRLSA